jgi:2,3-bisphosphoglycerate-independent phosphoglycerate mutase
LQASGTAVGLPAKTPGNSEVGHMTLGAGRVIEQPVTLINHAIADGSFFSNKKLKEGLAHLAAAQKTLHVIGLLSDGNVHSSQEHLYAYLKAALDAKVARIVVHAILDGRDVAPRSAAQYLERLDQFCKQHQNVVMGTIIGRFYAMDRDDNWNRTAAAYECLTVSEPIRFKSWSAALEYCYTHNLSDEFVPPTQLNEQAVISEEDGIIFFNLRPDRARQLIDAFADHDFEHFATRDLHLLFFITPVELGDWSAVTVLFPRAPVHENLKEILSKKGMSLFCIAETEKYAHVTYFFSGLNDHPYKGEEQVLVPSLKLKDYKENPAMSAAEITKTVVQSLQKDPRDFYLINYANADMVGHSGDLPATIKAVECLDAQLKVLYEEVVEKRNGMLYITSDHGNADLEFDETTGQPHTAHTTNPVPFIYVDQAVKDKKMELSLKGLADVASFILENLKLPIPAVMQKKTN